MPRRSPAAPGCRRGCAGVRARRRTAAPARRRSPPARTPQRTDVAGSRSCQRTPVPPISSWVMPRVEGDLGGERGEDLARPSRAPVSSPSAAASSASTCQTGRTPPGAGPRAHALQAAVGVGDGALLLGVGLGGEDDVGVPGRRVLEHRRSRATKSPGRAPRSSRGRREVADRVGVDRGSRLELARRRGRRGSRRRRGRRSRLGEARARRPAAADLAQAAPVGAVRDLDQAGAVRSSHAAGRARSRAEPRPPRGRARAARPRRSPVEPGAQRPGDALGVLAERRPAAVVARRRRASRPAPRAKAPRLAGRVAQPSRRRRRRARSGRSVATTSGRRCGARPCGSAGRGSASRAAGRCRARGSTRRGRCRRCSRASSGRESSTRSSAGVGRAPCDASRRAAEPSASRTIRWIR